MKTCPQCSASYPDEYVACPKDGARLTGASFWEPDSVIRGKYRIVARIGEGGMAAVYKAHHQLLDEPRALKVINPELARDHQFVQRFKNEAIITRKLQHPNAVRVDDLDIAEDGRPFIAMELVEGEGLKNLILRAGPLNVAQVLDIALQVCEAIQAAHALGLIHRDIKPDNVVLVSRPDAPPLAKILDFGIARLKEGTPGAGRAGLTLTGTGVVIGTPDYMSPEQALGKRGDEIDGRSDLYSLGIVMYRMLTGELPFKADTTVEMILHHIQTIPKPPQVLRPELKIPDSVSAIVMQALEKDREKRFASAAAMGDALRRAQQRLTLVGHASAATQPLTRARTGPAQPEPPRPLSPPPPNVPEGAPRRPAAAKHPPTAAVPREVALAGKPAIARPSSPPSRPKKGFPTTPAVVGMLALALLILGITTLKRHAPPQTQPQAASPAPVPALTSQAPDARAASPASTQPLGSSSPGLESPTKPNPPITAGQTQESPPAAPASTQSPSNIAPGQEPEPAATSGDSTSIPNRFPQPRQAQWPGRNPQEMPRRGQSEMGAQREKNRQLNEMATQLARQGAIGKAAQIFRQVLAVEPDNQHARKGLEKCIEAIREQRQRNRPSMTREPGQSRPNRR